MIQDIDQQTQKNWQNWVHRKVEFYINSGQWDNITIAGFRKWLANFDAEGMQFVVSLLDKSIYYSEDHIKRLCSQALTKTL